MAKTRVGIIGAGYIASWHADALRATKGAALTAVCDASASAAEGFAAAYGLQAFTDLGDMLAADVVDAVHILTPPNLHHALALQCIAAGLHVVVEKPVAMSAAETREMAEAAQARGVTFAAGHNFLGIPAYQRLKTALARGRLGRVSTAEITWAFPLGPLRAGPYGIWLMRESRNLLLELGPHLYAFMTDLFGPAEILHLETAKEIALPGGGTRPQSWRVTALAGDVDVLITLSLVETHDDRSVVLRGSSGMARLDYANDTLTIAAPNTSDLVLNPLRAELGQGWAHLREGVRNAAVQLTSLNQKSPYGQSFRGLCAAVYGAIAENRPVDARFSGESVVQVMEGIDATLAHLRPDPPLKKPKGTPKPDVMVIGGTGFIGRALTRALVARGHDVRVLSRGRTGPFDDIANHVETVGASLYDEDALREAMTGIKHVYNLAKSMDKTWEAALENDVGVSLRIARAARDAGVERLVYTGTIASYDMSDPGQTITEDTDFGDLEERNIYARSKAECERRLMEMNGDGIEIVVARPGIVVGEGGPLQHWGIGRWHGAGAVKIWGHGRNILPFVLIGDCADGLVRMIEVEEAAGQSFNLVGEPMLSARGYFDAIHDALGARIRVSPGPLWAFFAADAVKFFLKTRVLRRKGLSRPSLKDWKSRAHFSPFENARPKTVLGWQPETDRARFIDAAITRANLMGF
ncbi:NAD-dependent epimerase/dehydratase family protein [Marimonas lutisalis]|uniref:NAD-dependent epimerase/dehydratase family protein n=1 Tax=Marimonas lutisalis TaxID=2545756 RepID=UPI0010F987CE|nr:NAD-dependent epimerase/dehydratase family protein [Marimonas lutisalis]